MKSLLKAMLRRTPYRVVRAGDLNRFDAVAEMLLAIRDRGLKPNRVVDGGANIGSFALAAAAAFPSATIDMIEPQPACAGALTALSAQHGFQFHPIAIVGPSHERETIPLNYSPDEITTGANVSPQPSASAVDVPAATLDAVIGGQLSETERILVKLDLQGYELEALRGAERTLVQTDAILTEVSFFAQTYEPSIAELVAFLNAHAFQLYDIAALNGRMRDGRARQGDFIFVREGSKLATDTRWC